MGHLNNRPLQCFGTRTPNQILGRGGLRLLFRSGEHPCFLKRGIPRTGQSTAVASVMLCEGTVEGGKRATETPTFSDLSRSFRQTNCLPPSHPYIMPIRFTCNLKTRLFSQGELDEPGNFQSSRHLCLHLMPDQMLDDDGRLSYIWRRRRVVQERQNPYQ